MAAAVVKLSYTHSHTWLDFFSVVVLLVIALLYFIHSGKGLPDWTCLPEWAMEVPKPERPTCRHEKYGSRHSFQDMSEEIPRTTCVPSISEKLRHFVCIKLPWSRKWALLTRSFSRPLYDTECMDGRNEWEKALEYERMCAWVSF